MSLLRIAALTLLLVAAYYNHFDNAFHFDDFHTVVDNTAVHTLDNWKQFFQDPAAFSVLTTHQVYRPLVTLSLSADWTLAGGANTRWFHISTFLWLIVLAVTLWALFARLLRNEGWAWFATALFAVHPVSAETVNYIIQRGDLYATLGVTAALYLFLTARSPLYLLPFAAGALSKTTALVFPLLLAAYLAIYRDRRWSSLAPSVAATLVLGLLAWRMTGAGFNPGAASAGLYRATQGFVSWHYFTQFFWPAALTADTDMTSVAAYSDPRVWSGALFAAALLAVIACTAKRDKEAAFGLAWFLIALLPTAVMPLAEVANDHRMFMAFPGLCLAAGSLAKRLPRARWVPAAAALVLAASVTATHFRNEVWRTEESLWRDVTVKSPRNGRGLMNYGLTLMARGETRAALDYFERAAVFNPRYPILEINRAIANGVLGRDGDAERHFRHAVEWSPAQSSGYFYYGRWLWQRNRRTEAAANLERAVALNPRDFAARSLMAEIHAGMQQWRELDTLVQDTLSIAPTDATALRFKATLAETRRHAEDARSKAEAAPAPERFIELSLAHFRSGRYLDCVEAARQALRLRPDYAEAYNNIAAGYNALRMWDEGIRAAQTAVRLKPDWELARNNLNHALAQKAAAGQ
ncbi:MAG: hypothetical protein FJW30_14930 [Acidobacteria bacterium]|nr:hypothetical protein [Acidobacteriota bacterium]